MTQTRGRAGKLAIFAVAAAALCALAVPMTPANAQVLGQIYLGWDFGNGFGIGIGQVPSSYNPCPTYGWPVYPNRCAAPAAQAIR